MNRPQRIAASWALIALSMILAALAAISHLRAASIAGAPVVGQVPMQAQAYSTIGQGSLTFSGTGQSVLNLAGTAGTSTPCQSLTLSVSGASVLVGSTTASQPLVVPSGLTTWPVANVNGLYVKGGTASTVGYFYYNN